MLRYFWLFWYCSSLLFSLLASKAVSAEWLLRASPSTALMQELATEPVYLFANGDVLLRLSKQDLALLPSHSSSIRYIEFNQDLVTQPPLFQSPEAMKAFAASTATGQDFLQNDGFMALSDEKRACAQVNLAVIDSGVDLSHQQLANIEFNAAYDARTELEELSDEYGHGTHVTGLIAAQATTELPMQGACVNANIMPIRFLDRYGGGSVADAVKGVRWAIEHQAQLINHSWTIKSHSQALLDVLTEANNLGIVQVAAAGNIAVNADESPVYPAAYATQLNGFLAVANWDHEQQQLFTSSNFGMTSVDLAASGTNLLSLAPNDQTQLRTGTSMAAPLVSATAAMLLQQSPSLTASQVRAILLQSSQAETGLRDKVRSGRRLNAYNALNFELNEPSIFFAQLNVGEIELYGEGFEQGDVWQFQRVSGSEISEIIEQSPLSITNNKVAFVEQELGNGYWQVFRSGELIAQLAYQPELPKPSYLQAQQTEQGILLTWSASTLSQYYQLQADIDGSGFVTLADLTAPTNQFEHQIGDYSSLRYRIRASYEYQFFAGQPSTEYSAYSDIFTLSADNLIWNTQLFASIPVGSNAIFPLQTEEEGAYFSLEQDPQSVVQGLSSDGLLKLDTQQALQASIELKLQGSGEQSNKHFEIQVHDEEYWEMHLNAEEQLQLYDTNSVLYSWQGLSSGLLLIHGESAKAVTLVLNLVSSKREFEGAQLLLNGSELPAEQFTLKDKQLLITLPETTEPQFELSLKLSYLERAAASHSDSRCFLASAVYAEQPKKLAQYRAFRDEFLLKSPTGQAMVELYYQYSPYWVLQVNKQPELKPLLTRVLDLFVE